MEVKLCGFHKSLRWWLVIGFWPIARSWVATYDIGTGKERLVVAVVFALVLCPVL